MKILKIAYEWPVPWQGLFPHIYELTKAQTKFGHQFYMLSGRWARTGPVEEVDNVKFLYFLNSPGLPFRAPIPGTMLVTVSIVTLFRYLAFRFSKEGKSIDIVHTHGQLALWVYAYRAFLRSFLKKSPELDVKFVAHFHIIAKGRAEKLAAKGEEPKPITKYIDWPLHMWFEKLAIEQADQLVFVSEENKQEAIKYYNADPSKCTVVTTGVNPQLFTPAGVEEHVKIHKDFGLEETDKIILNLGMMVKRKNIHLLVQALKFLPESYKLLLVGPCPDKNYREYLDTEVQNKGLSARVLTVDYAPYPEIPILYQGSDIFVLPSSAEGTPKVVMEALSTGVPVLASSVKLPEQIDGFYTLENLDPKFIAQKIEEILASKDSVDRAKVASIYSWRRRAEILEQVYAKLN